MPDNTELNVGIGGSLMSDELIGGVHIPRIKVISGASGSDGGDITATNPFSVETQGMAADGAPAIGFPVWIAGWDGIAVRALDVDILGRAATRVLDWFGSSAPTVGQKTMLGSIPVTLASDQTPIKSSVSTTSQVADSAVAVTLLAANAARRGGSITNDSTEAMIIKLGAGVTLTDWSLPIASGGYYEIPYGYTGQIDAMWQAATATGEAKITEYT